MAGVLRAQSALLAAWIIFWVLLTAIVLLRHRPSSKPVGMAAAAHRRLAISHRISASITLLLFVVPPLVNHLAGFWSAAAHIELMKAIRYVYRDDILQPVLLALIGFQILNGIVLRRRRLTMPSDFLGTLWTMCGDIGVCFLAHMTAVFAARHSGTDTNWN